MAPFVPTADSNAVTKLLLKIGTGNPPVSVIVLPEPTGKHLDCFITVREKVRREGGQIRFGWAVWQHGDLFIEGEHHAVYDPGDGREWIDCTPNQLRATKILFIPDDDAGYDYETSDVSDNIRVPLVEDARVTKALELLAEMTRLKNSVPGVDIILPQHIVERLIKLQNRASALLAKAMAPPSETAFKQKIGRNDPCPCGSGKKYKKCCAR